MLLTSKNTNPTLILYDLLSNDLALREESQVKFIKDSMQRLRAISKPFDRQVKCWDIKTVDINVQIFNLRAIYTFSNSSEIIVAKHLSAFWLTFILQKYKNVKLSSSFTVNLGFL